MPAAGYSNREVTVTLTHRQWDQVLASLQASWASALRGADRLAALNDPADADQMHGLRRKCEHLNAIGDRIRNAQTKARNQAAVESIARGVKR